VKFVSMSHVMACGGVHGKHSSTGASVDNLQPRLNFFLHVG
jgi:hypothetical protein